MCGGGVRSGEGQRALSPAPRRPGWAPRSRLMRALRLAAALLGPGSVSGAGAWAAGRGQGGGGREAAAPGGANSSLRREAAGRREPRKASAPRAPRGRPSRWPGGAGDTALRGATRSRGAALGRRVFPLKLARTWEPGARPAGGARRRGRGAPTALDSPHPSRRARRGRRRTAQCGGTVKRWPASGPLPGVGREPADGSQMEAARGGAE